MSVARPGVPHAAERPGTATNWSRRSRVICWSNLYTGQRGLEKGIARGLGRVKEEEWKLGVAR